MADAEFKPGDLVELKSGSDPMTISWVEEYLGTMSAACHWVVKTKAGQEAKEKVFPLVVLKHHEPKPRLQVPVMKSGFP